jgi:hypothetical protein
MSAPSQLVLLLILWVLCAQYVLNLIYWLVLRTSLARAQPTSERITFGEQLDAMAGAVPRGFLIVYAVFFTAFIAVSGFVVFRAKAWDIMTVTGLVFGLGGAYFFAMLAKRRKTKQY